MAAPNIRQGPFDQRFIPVLEGGGGGLLQKILHRFIQPQGKGALALAYEQLFKKLESEGLFDSSHKKPLPEYPKKIGVATSNAGAAVRDIMITLRRRFPQVSSPP